MTVATVWLGVGMSVNGIQHITNKHTWTIGRKTAISVR